MVRRAGQSGVVVLGRMSAIARRGRKVFDIQQFVADKEKARIAAGFFGIWLLDLGSNQGPTD